MGEWAAVNPAPQLDHAQVHLPPLVFAPPLDVDDGVLMLLNDHPYLPQER